MRWRAAPQLPPRQAILTRMSKDSGPWQDGRRAWERLKGWHHDAPAKRARTDDGDGALKALLDVGLVRHLLDQAELVAVRTARRHGKSWSEIATKLGVTRQSAWERWRDLDDEPSDAGTTDTGTTDTGTTDTAATDTGAAVLQTAATELARRQAQQLRRRSSVVVPNVIAMSWDDARNALFDKGLVAVGPDPDGPPLAALGWPDAVVRDQSPESGAKVPAGSPVTLWLDRGGGSGVREPRRPKPAPMSAREMRPEPTDEAVG
jgi:PASTA domain